MELRFTLPAVLMAALLLATACGNDNDDNKDRYATNKAGERLVEKIEYINPSDSTEYGYDLYSYTTDGTVKSYIDYFQYYDGGLRQTKSITTIERRNNTITAITNGFNYENNENEDLYSIDTLILNLNSKGLAISGFEKEINKYNQENISLNFIYTPNDQLQDIYHNDVLLGKFEWENGNIRSYTPYEEDGNPYRTQNYQYEPQPNASNIDWCGYLGYIWVARSGDASICLFSSGLLGKKNKDLISHYEDGDIESSYSYEFDEDGYVSGVKVYSDGKIKSHWIITYLKK